MSNRPLSIADVDNWAKECQRLTKKHGGFYVTDLADFRGYAQFSKIARDLGYIIRETVKVKPSGISTSVAVWALDKFRYGHAETILDTYVKKEAQRYESRKANGKHVTPEPQGEREANLRATADQLQLTFQPPVPEAAQPPIDAHLVEMRRIVDRLDKLIEIWTVSGQGD